MRELIHIKACKIAFADCRKRRNSKKKLNRRIHLNFWNRTIRENNDNQYSIGTIKY